MPRGITVRCTNTKHHHLKTRFCPDCGVKLPDVIRIDHLDQLQEVAALLGVGGDWHEPDNAEVTAKVDGHCFDNAGFWPSWHVSDAIRDNQSSELCVILYKEGEPRAMINLATLFAIACRTHT